MIDQEFSQQQQRLRDLADKWCKPLGLGWWNIEFAYARDDYKPPDGHKASESERSLAYCGCDWRYGEACITWNMPVVKEQDNAKLETAFVHELMHIFLNEMRWTRQDGQDDLDHEERVASTLTKAFLWLRDHLTEKTDESTAAPPDVVPERVGDDTSL